MTQRKFELTDYGKDYGFGRFVVREGSELLYGGEWLTDALVAIRNAIFPPSEKMLPEIPAPEPIKTEIRKLEEI